MSNNIKKAELSQNAVMSFLNRKGLRTKDVLLLMAESGGDYYLQPIKSTCETGSVKEFENV